MAELIVTVKQGQLRGKEDTDVTGKTYYKFQGIPYAKAPVGNLRFKDPQPVEPWKGIRDATTEGSICLQKHLFEHTMTGSEDCLFLNVYTPQLLKGKNDLLKPVMFWIHGGAFSGGSGNSDVYGPDFLIAHDVVLVTINYRVGVLGFMKLEDPALEVPGNAGFKDIMMALRWINENIKNFKGDPNNITIFGESAGSAAVQYLLVSPLVKGLFHKAIMQSGSLFSSWARGYHSSTFFSKVLGLNNADERQILNMLQKFSTSELFEFQEKLNDNALDGSKRPYGPTVEKPSESAFLADEPKEILQSGTHNKVPLIIGYCDAEGILSILWEAQRSRQPIHQDFENFVPHTFGLERGSNESLQIAEKIRKFYYKDKKPSMETLENYVQLETDVFFIHSIQKSIECTLKNSKQPIYFYRFCFDGEHNFLKKLVLCNIKGAAHADELSYLFKTQVIQDNLKPGSPEELTMNRLTKLWTNFAKNGNPNPQVPDDLFNIQWKPVEKSMLNFINVDKELSTGVNPDSERIKFWDKLFDDYPFAKYW